MNQYNITYNLKKMNMPVVDFFSELTLQLPLLKLIKIISCLFYNKK